MANHCSEQSSEQSRTLRLRSVTATSTLDAEPAEVRSVTATSILLAEPAEVRSVTATSILLAEPAEARSVTTISTMVLKGQEIKNRPYPWTDKGGLIAATTVAKAEASIKYVFRSG